MGISDPGFDAKNIRETVLESAELFVRVAKDIELQEKTREICEMIISALRAGNKIMICGNGGSAADAQHFAGEMVGTFLIKNRPGLAAIALNTDTSVLTSVGNDSSYDNIFSQQVGAIGRTGDVLIGISTSGNSKNVVKAFETGRKKRLKLVALLGCGGVLPEMADIALKVPSSSTPRIQEIHALLIHIICGYVEAEMFKDA
ncbi:MAG: SIS domain-containing protein [Synergistaceae bacterium]|nr:SIS domain-containing protein [Synergistaceae bacterium]